MSERFRVEPIRRCGQEGYRVWDENLIIGETPHRSDADEFITARRERRQPRPSVLPGWGAYSPKNKEAPPAQS